jgi:hypothetical protein
MKSIAYLERDRKKLKIQGGSNAGSGEKVRKIQKKIG